MDKEYERTFNLLQEIPFATQQAWHRKKGKERKYSVSLMHAIGKAQPSLRICQQY